MGSQGGGYEQNKRCACIHRAVAQGQHGGLDNVFKNTYVQAAAVKTRNGDVMQGMTSVWRANEMVSSLGQVSLMDSESISAPTRLAASFDKDHADPPPPLKPCTQGYLAMQLLDALDTTQHLWYCHTECHKRQTYFSRPPHLAPVCCVPVVLHCILRAPIQLLCDACPVAAQYAVPLAQGQLL